MSTDAPNADDPEARSRALGLLEATHRFPCEYAVTVIAFNRDTVTVEVKRAVVQRGDEGEDPAELTSHEMRESREGKYLSHRIAVRVSCATDVLDLYARLRLVEGVVTLL